MFGKARHDCWFCCPGCIHYININRGLYLLFHYLRQGMAFLDDCYFVPGRHKKRRCFLGKRWLNSTILRISKLKSLALLIYNFNMLRNVFNDLNLIRNRLERWYVFYLHFLTLVKLSQSTKFFNWKWFDLVFYLIMLPTKWQNWLQAPAFAFYLPICIKS